MGLALEEPTTDDITYEQGSITWALPARDEPMLMGYGGLKVDHHDYEHGSFFHIARTGPGTSSC